MPPLQPTQQKNLPREPRSACSDSCSLADASFHEQGIRVGGPDVTSKSAIEALDPIGPHIALLKELGGVPDSYRAIQPMPRRSPAEKRFEDSREQADRMLELRAREARVPKDARIIDISIVLADQEGARAITSFKGFLDRAGIVPGETAHIKLPDGSFSAIRRRVLDVRVAADEVVWVETLAAVGYLHNLEFFDGRAHLLPSVSYDIRGFFDPESRIAVMPMIEKRNGRSRAEWRVESLITLQTAVHELEHGRGGGEYQARAAADEYLCRNCVMPAPEPPERRLGSISRGWYSSEEYCAAVGDAMRELKASLRIVPSRIPDPEVESVPLPIVASASVGTFEDLAAMRRGDAAELLSYGLTQGVGDRWNGRRLIVRQEGASSHLYRWLGEPLADRLMQETLQAENLTLRILVAEALSHHVAHECMRLAKLLKSEDSTSQVVRALADDIANHLEPGDVHLAVRNYVSHRGGAAMIPHGKETAWINSLPEGLSIRRADSVTIYLASPRHRGAALRMPIQQGGGLCHVGRASSCF